MLLDEYLKHCVSFKENMTEKNQRKWLIICCVCVVTIDILVEWCGKKHRPNKLLKIGPWPILNFHEDMQSSTDPYILSSLYAI